MQSTANKSGMTVNEFLRRFNIAITFVAMMVFAVIATGKSFFTGDNLLNVVERASIIGLVALGQGLVIYTGKIDLSVNAVMDISFTSVAVLAYSGMSYGLTIVIALLIGALVGVVNGLLVVKTNIPPWLITLSTMMMVNALALQWSGTTEIRFAGLQEFINNMFHMDASSSRYFSGALWIAFGLLFAFMLGKTRFGMNIYFVGGGTKAAYLSGIRTDVVNVLVYTISGVMAALTGIVLAYRVGSLNPTSAEAYQLYSIAACALGGASLSGGVGTAYGTFFGAVVLAILTNVLNIMQVNIYIQNSIMGILLIMIVSVTSALAKRK